MSGGTIDGTVLLKKYSYPVVNGATTETLLDTQKCWAEIKSVGRSEFYTAAQAGTAVQLIFRVWAFEYEGHQRATYRGEDYDIIRAYQTDVDHVELTAARRTGR